MHEIHAAVYSWSLWPKYSYTCIYEKELYYRSNNEWPQIRYLLKVFLSCYLWQLYLHRPCLGCPRHSVWWITDPLPLMLKYRITAIRHFRTLYIKRHVSKNARHHKLGALDWIHSIFKVKKCAFSKIWYGTILELYW